MSNILLSLISKKKGMDIDVMSVFDGDSLTAGNLNAQTYPNRIKDVYFDQFKSYEFYSFGVAGQSTQLMISDASVQIDPLIDLAKTNIVIAWEDVNAILNVGRTAQENFNDFVTYFQGRKDAGFDKAVLITGYYPRLVDNSFPLAWTEEIRSAHTSFLNLIKFTDTRTVPWDVHVDLRNVPIIGGLPEQDINTTYFKDWVHLKDDGYNLISDYIWDNGIKELFI